MNPKDEGSHETLNVGRGLWRVTTDLCAESWRAVCTPLCILRQDAEARVRVVPSADCSTAFILVLIGSRFNEIALTVEQQKISARRQVQRRAERQHLRDGGQWGIQR